MLADRIRDRQFIINAADVAWRAGAAAGIVGLPGLLLEERVIRTRIGNKGRTLTTGGGSLGIRESDDEERSTKRFSTVVAEVESGSTAFYAGGFLIISESSVKAIRL